MKPVCLVIGAGAGIGGNVAKKFASEGYHSVLCRRTDQEGLDRMVSEIESSGGSASGYLLNAIDENSIEERITEIEKDEEIIIMLDSLNDSQNVGSILRTAYLFGVQTIIYNKDNSFKPNSFMIKSASGSYEKIKMIEVTNLNKTIDFLKKNGFWVIGLDSNSDKTVKTIYDNEKKVLIFGSEDKGIRKLIKKNCDFIVKIKTIEKDDDIVDSLNVSHACAIILNQLTTKNETTT